MATYYCYPPHRHHSTHRIAPSKALSLLSDYLTAASTDASLHPNALLTETGPITPASGTHQMGLVLHNLKRVEAGLKGERLAADLTVGEDGEGEFLTTELPAQGPSEGKNDGAATDNNGWQDKAEFEREQGIEQGEVGERNKAVGGRADGISVPKVGVEGAKVDLDKEARKRKKKERRLQVRKESTAKKLKEKNLED